MVQTDKKTINQNHFAYFSGSGELLTLVCKFCNYV